MPRGASTLTVVTLGVTSATGTFLLGYVVGGRFAQRGHGESGVVLMGGHCRYSDSDEGSGGVLHPAPPCGQAGTEVYVHG